MHGYTQAHKYTHHAHTDEHTRIWIDEKTGNTPTCRVMAVRAYTGMRNLIAEERTRACVLSSQINAAVARRKEEEQKAAAFSAIERKALEEARARGPTAGHFKQVIETCEPLDTIFADIDLLARSPTSRRLALPCETRAFVRIGYRRRRKNGRPVGKGRLEEVEPKGPAK